VLTALRCLGPAEREAVQLVLYVAFVASDVVNSDTASVSAAASS